MTPYHNNDTFRPILISTVLMHSFNERMMTMHKNRERNVSLFIKPIILTKRGDHIINVWKNIIKCVQTITDEMSQEGTDIAMGMCNCTNCVQDNDQEGKTDGTPVHSLPVYKEINALQPDG